MQTYRKKINWMHRTVFPLSTLPSDLIGLILAACVATDLPSLAATSILLQQTTSKRRNKLAMLQAPPFHVKDLHGLLELDLQYHHIADAQLITLVDACASGALDKLQTLNLSKNKIGDAGISALADSVCKGALPALQKLALYCNYIGDVGMTAFAEAVGKGALPALQKLCLSWNFISDAGIAALASALESGALHDLRVSQLANAIVPIKAGMHTLSM